MTEKFEASKGPEGEFHAQFLGGLLRTVNSNRLRMIKIVSIDSRRHISTILRTHSAVRTLYGLYGTLAACNRHVYRVIALNLIKH